MDNDNEIKISKPEVRLFLGDQLLYNDSSVSGTYDLEREYAKTKTNKSIKTYLALIVTFVVVIVMTFAFSRYVSVTNERVAVNVEAFEDLNLKDLLNAVTRVQNALNLAFSERDEIELRLKTETAIAEEKRDGDLFMLDSMNLDKASYNKQKEIIVAQCRRSLSFINANYERDMKKVEEKIKNLSEQLAAMDSANVERAKQQQAELDSQQQLYELEKQQMMTDFEGSINDLRSQMQTQRSSSIIERNRAIETVSSMYKKQMDVLDPLFEDSDAKHFVSQAAILPDEQMADLGALLNLSNLSESDVFLINAMKDKYAGLNYLLEQLETLPFRNDPKQYTAAAVKFNQSLSNDIAELATSILNSRTGAQNEVAKMESLIDSFAHYVDNDLKESGDNGCVVDARNPSAIVVYISPLYASSIDGKTAFVFRSATEMIGSVTLKKDGPRTIAIPENRGVGALMQTGDRLIIDFASTKTKRSTNFTQRSALSKATKGVNE